MHPDSVSLKTVREATTCLINKRRAKRGLNKLGGQSQLREAATDHSEAMVKKRFFSHTSSNGDSPTDRIRATGYLKGSNNWATGENIGWGADWRAEPKAMVRAWMNSSPHRASILSRTFRHVGVGIERGAPRDGVSGAATYTTDFGRH